MNAGAWAVLKFIDKPAAPGPQAECRETNRGRQHDRDVCQYAKESSHSEIVPLRCDHTPALQTRFTLPSIGAIFMFHVFMFHVLMSHVSSGLSLSKACFTPAPPL